MMAWFAVITMLSGCANYVPGAKAYWDAKVKEMCEKDGGVMVYQRVHISKDEIDRHVLPMSGGRLSVAVKQLARPDAPVYAVESITTLRNADPIIRRTESAIVRRRDEAVVARAVRYARLGGDFPTGVSEGTSFICPDPKEIAAELDERLFVIEGEAK